MKTNWRIIADAELNDQFDQLNPIPEYNKVARVSNRIEAVCGAALIVVSVVIIVIMYWH